MTRARVEMLASGEVLESPYPIADLVPSIYQEDTFVRILADALDSVLAPVFLILDNLEAHFDPSLAPDDFVEWLALWVGLDIDDTWSPDFTRDAVARTVELYVWRGTVRGIREILELYTGVVPEIIESGGTDWSLDVDPIAPGSQDIGMTVRLPLADLSDADLHRLDQIISSVKPAHVPHRVELLAP